MSPRRRWSAEEDALLRAHYPDTPTAELARRLGRSVTTTYQHANKLGLVKSAAYLASPAACRLRRGGDIGAAHRYPKGHVPANKGLRRPGWAPGQMASTQFVKGQAGWNWKPVGYERLIDGYRWTKVSDLRRVAWTVNWRPTHVLTWEAAHGPVPAGHVVVFRSRDKSDVGIKNLELIAREDLMRRNSVHNLPAPLPQTIQLLGALNRKINRSARAHEEQDRRPQESPVRGTGRAGGSGQADGDRTREGDCRCGPSDRGLGASRSAVPRGDGCHDGDGIHRTAGGRSDRATAARTAGITQRGIRGGVPA